MRKKLLFLLTTAVMAMGMLVAIAPAAQAAPLTVSPGLKWTTIGQPDSGSFCSLSGVGNDAFGNPVALSAGHCVEGKRVGDPVYVYDDVSSPMGTIAAVNPTIDYVVIKLAPGVAMKSQGVVRVDGIGVNPVPPFTMLCKGGATTGNTCGFSTFPGETRIYTIVPAFFGDSGGALVQGSKLVGHTVGFTTNPPAVEYARLDVVLNDLAVKNLPGKGFVPVNN